MATQNGIAPHRGASVCSDEALLLLVGCAGTVSHNAEVPVGQVATLVLEGLGTVCLCCSSGNFMSRMQQSLLRRGIGSACYTPRYGTGNSERYLQPGILRTRSGYQVRTRSKAVPLASLQHQGQTEHRPRIQGILAYCRAFSNLVSENEDWISAAERFIRTIREYDEAREIKVHTCKNRQRASMKSCD
jgi:hypothetical protein